MDFTKTYNHYWRGVKEKAEVLSELSVTFPTKYEGPITLTKLEAEGMCPHHGLPTHYEGELTYTPSATQAVGTSKPYMALRAIAAQPILAEDVFEEFWNEFMKRVKPRNFSLILKCKFECNHKDGVSRDAELVLNRTV